MKFFVFFSFCSLSLWAVDPASDEEGGDLDHAPNEDEQDIVQMWELLEGTATQVVLEYDQRALETFLDEIRTTCPFNPQEIYPAFNDKLQAYTQALLNHIASCESVIQDKELLNLFVDFLRGQYIYLFCQIISLKWRQDTAGSRQRFLDLMRELGVFLDAEEFQKFKKICCLELYGIEHQNAGDGNDPWRLYEMFFGRTIRLTLGNSVGAFPIQAIIQAATYNFLVREAEFFWQLSRTLKGASKDKGKSIFQACSRFQDLVWLCHALHLLPMDELLFHNREETCLTFAILSNHTCLSLMLFLIFSGEKFSESGCSILEACNKEGWSAWNLMIYCLDPQNIFFQLGNVSKTAVYDIEIFLLKKFLNKALSINHRDQGGRRPLWVALALFLKDPKYVWCLEAVLENPLLDIHCLFDEAVVKFFNWVLHRGDLCVLIEGKISNVLYYFNQCLDVRLIEGILIKLINKMHLNKMHLPNCRAPQEHGALKSKSHWINYYTHFTAQRITLEVSRLQAMILNSPFDESIPVRLEALLHVLNNRLTIAGRPSWELNRQPAVHRPANQTRPTSPGNDGVNRVLTFSQWRPDSI